MSSKVSLGFAIPYYSIPCGQSSPDWPNGHRDAGRPQGEFDLLITKILDSQLEGIAGVEILYIGGSMDSLDLPAPRPLIPQESSPHTV